MYLRGLQGREWRAGSRPPLPDSPPELQVGGEGGVPGHPQGRPHLQVLPLPPLHRPPHRTGVGGGGFTTGGEGGKQVQKVLPRLLLGRSHYGLGVARVGHGEDEGQVICMPHSWKDEETSTFLDHLQDWGF